jgi:hypothetical protein
MSVRRIRTRFRSLELGPERQPAEGPGRAASSLSDLLFELRARNPDVVRSVREMLGRQDLFGSQSLDIDSMFADLEEAVRAGELRLDEVEPPTIPPGLELVDADAEAEAEPEEQKELTFIEVQLRDQDDKPFPNRKVRIELHTGEVRERIVGSDASMRIDSIESSGIATVTVTGPNDPSDGPPDNPPDVEPQLIELVLVDAEDNPLPNVEAEITGARRRWSPTGPGC